MKGNRAKFLSNTIVKDDNVEKVDIKEQPTPIAQLRVHLHYGQAFKKSYEG